MAKLAAKQYAELDKIRHSCEVDLQFGCMYFRVGKGQVAKTVEITDYINVDFNKSGKVVGVESIGNHVV